jgi:hypothetical protein
MLSLAHKESGRTAFSVRAESVRFRASQDLRFVKPYSPECVEGGYSEVRIRDRTGAYSRPRIFMQHHNM